MAQIDRSSPEANETRTIIRVGVSTFVLGSILFSPFLFVALILLIKIPEQLSNALLLCAYYAAFLVVLCSPTIILEPDKLTYRWLLKTFTVDLAGVRRACVTAHNIAPTLELHSGHHARTFNFIIKPFSLGGIASILQHIRRFSPDVEFDDKCNDLLRGDTRSVTREVLTAQNLIRLATTIGGATFVAALVRNCSH